MIDIFARNRNSVALLRSREAGPVHLTFADFKGNGPVNWATIQLVVFDVFANGDANYQISSVATFVPNPCAIMLFMTAATVRRLKGSRGRYENLSSS